jgi:hypothetical protein
MRHTHKIIKKRGKSEEKLKEAHKIKELLPLFPSPHLPNETKSHPFPLLMFSTGQEKATKETNTSSEILTNTPSIAKNAQSKE